MNNFCKGQRWVSEAEPDLGLGRILEVSAYEVHVFFAAHESLRRYSAESAPLRRVSFSVGDEIKNHQDQKFRVTKVEEKDEILYYHCGSVVIPEEELADSLSFSKPQERLLDGRIDETHLFDLRSQCLEAESFIHQSPLRGLSGGRIDLLPHQLYVASEVTKRVYPRVLLSDEVGLGKTIEAALILHRLVLSGRTARVLVVVPESLVHQWLVELMRKFNIRLHIYDEDRCQSLVGEGNPFYDEQLVLCSREFITSSAKRREQILTADWDMVIVDEAHHMDWRDETAGNLYEFMQELSRQVEGLLLLTATPNQFGHEHTFALLRLIDASRFHSFEAYLQESHSYGELATLTEKLIENEKLSGKEKEIFGKIDAEEEGALTALLTAYKAGDEESLEEFKDLMIDRHGTGRMMFRNKRQVMKGFPQRRLVEKEIANNDHDTKVAYVLDLLQEFSHEKILLICATKELAIEVDNSIQRLTGIKSTVFHEDLSIVQRDRNAAYFGESLGARILCCSEIGSEGRNFQFAHHLVLFDLPANPGLLEQRIGRLDRIGQAETINIHVPFARGSQEELLLCWYRDALSVFCGPLHGTGLIMRDLGKDLTSWLNDAPEEGQARVSHIKKFVEQSQEINARITVFLESGRDRLLEWNSFREKPALELVEQVGDLDSEPKLEKFMSHLLEMCGVGVVDQEAHVYSLQPGSGMVFEALPGLPSEGALVTFNRRKALNRDDLLFLTWDHPMVEAAVEQALGGENGNSSFARYPDESSRTMLLEAYFTVECPAPSSLLIQRFLSRQPLRLLVNHKLEDLSTSFSPEDLSAKLIDADFQPFLQMPMIGEQLVPAMLEALQSGAQKALSPRIATAKLNAKKILGEELNRLRHLQKMSASVSTIEIETLADQQKRIINHLDEASLRLDSLRFIWKGPESF